MVRRATLAGALAVLALLGSINRPAVAAQPHGIAAKWRAIEARLRKSSVPDVPGPIRFRDAQVEPVGWQAVDAWDTDDHAAAFAAFLVSCRPIAHTAHPPGENRPMYGALYEVCRRALRAGSLGEAAARKFFEDNFRPVRIAKLGEGAGFLTGYYEPVVDGSRFPTREFHVPIYRRPPDLLPPAGTPAGAGFPNTGQSLRRDASGKLVPYYNRADMEDGVLDGKRLEICWIRDPTEALFIQIQGSARIRLEDGLEVRINYDSHNGWPYTARSEERRVGKERQSRGRRT